MRTRPQQRYNVPEPYGGTSTAMVLDDKVWDEFQRTHVEVPWYTPMPVATFSGVCGLACRICIGRYGLLALHIGELPQTRADHAKHLASVHGVVEG